FFFLHSSYDHHNSRSFPTRRSSDLSISSTSEPAIPLPSSTALRGPATTAGPAASSPSIRRRENSSGVSRRRRTTRTTGTRRRCRSEEHTSELQSLAYLVCRLLLEKK